MPRASRNGKLSGRDGQQPYGQGSKECRRSALRGVGAIRKAMSGFSAARAASVPDGATEWPRSRHFILNHVINVNGDTAKTIAYWFEITNNTPQKDVQLVYFGHYEDQLARVHGHWLCTTSRYLIGRCSTLGWARRIRTRNSRAPAGLL